MLLEWLIRMGVAMLLGAAVGAIVYTVYTRITSSNLADIVRSAIQNAESDVFKKLLGRFLDIKVTEKSPNTISVSVLEADHEQVDGMRIQIESTEGVAGSVYKGMTRRFLA